MPLYNKLIRISKEDLHQRMYQIKRFNCIMSEDVKLGSEISKMLSDNNKKGGSEYYDIEQ